MDVLLILLLPFVCMWLIFKLPEWDLKVSSLDKTRRNNRLTMRGTSNNVGPEQHEHNVDVTGGY